MRIVAWNTERKGPGSPTGAAAVQRIAHEDPEIVVLTEARVGHLQSLETGSVMGPSRCGPSTAFLSPGEQRRTSLCGHEINSDPPAPGHAATDERKVIAWSRNPWRDVDAVGDARMPAGRFIAGTTSTSIGDLRVVAICIPWHMCDVRTGTKDRKPWEQHLRWLEYFGPLIATASALPVLIAGDFNQRIPRRPGARKDVAEALASAFAGHDIVTAGIPAGCDRQGIDHIAIDARLRATAVRGWPNNDGGVRMTDHDAVLADLAIDEGP